MYGIHGSATLDATIALLRSDVECAGNKVITIWIEHSMHHKVRIPRGHNLHLVYVDSIDNQIYHTRFTVSEVTGDREQIDRIKCDFVMYS